MTNIVVFGKPRAFESFEFVFDGNNSSAENTHREPLLKPKQYEEPILHYFVREGYAGLEYYTRARGFESERDGIVFGVSMKSTTDFNIIDTISYILQPFWIDFASALLDETNKFVEDSIVNRLKNTQWSQSEIDKIQSTSLHRPINSPQKDILLLVSPKLDDIKLVEHSIKEYEDVYLSGNPSVFIEQMNDIVLREAGNQIFKIEDGKIVPLQDEVRLEPHPEPQISVFRRIAQLPVWGNRRETLNLKDKRGNLKNKIEHRDFWLVTSFSAFSLVLIIAALIHFWTNGEKASGNQTNEGQTTDATEIVKKDTLTDATKAGESDTGTKDARKVIEGISVRLSPCNSSIKEEWSLNPTILPETCTTYYPSDITFEVSEKSLVSIKTDKKGNYKLVVHKRPSSDTEVVVKAFIKGSLMGTGTYTIAKLETKPKPDLTGTTTSIIPPFNGRPRTLDQWLGDLEKALNDGSYTPEFVESECQKLINSQEFQNNQKAVKLREKARSKKSKEPVKSAI